MKEQAIQKKIIDFLEVKGWIVIKIITANKSGWADLICCTPKGHFVALEVKVEGGKLSELQKHKLCLVAENNGTAGAVYGWEDFLVYWNSTLRLLQ